LRRHREHALVRTSPSSPTSPRRSTGDQPPGWSFWQTSWTGLVERALQERRVQRDDRAACRPSRGPVAKRHGVLLGDPDVEHALREAPRELRHPGAGRHPGGDPDDAPVLARGSISSAAKTAV
jgi:hypothetical protein